MGETERQFTMTGKIKGLSDVRENTDGKAYNLMVTFHDMRRGVFFFDTKERIEELRARLKSGQTAELTYVEDKKGMKGLSIKVISESKPEERNESTVKLVKTGVGKYELVDGGELSKYEDDYLEYAIRLYRKVSHAVKTNNTLVDYDGEEAVVSKTIFERMLEPFIYYMEGDLHLKQLQKQKEKQNTNQS